MVHFQITDTSWNVGEGILTNTDTTNGDKSGLMACNTESSVDKISNPCNKIVGSWVQTNFCTALPTFRFLLRSKIFKVNVPSLEVVCTTPDKVPILAWFHRCPINLWVLWNTETHHSSIMILQHQHNVLNSTNAKPWDAPVSFFLISRMSSGISPHLSISCRISFSVKCCAKPLIIMVLLGAWFL